MSIGGDGDFFASLPGQFPLSLLFMLGWTAFGNGRRTLLWAAKMVSSKFLSGSWKLVAVLRPSVLESQH